MSNVKQSLQLKHTPEVYSKLDIAKFSLQNRAKNCWVIMLGDDCKYWIVCLADSCKLAKAGYEYLPYGL